MRVVTAFPVLVLGLAALPASGGRADVAPIMLPEVSRHLGEGERALREGSAERAQAHADLVLVGTDVSVAIKTEGIEGKEATDAVRATEKAFDTWAAATDDDVAFVRDDADQDPTVTIRLMKDVVRNGEHLAGWVSWKRAMPSFGSGAKYRADISIRTRRTDGRRMSPAAVHHEVCHELGHVLGLDDVDAPNHIMGPLDPAHPCLGPCDAEAKVVRELRARARGIVARAERVGRSQ